jgi:hypothetical protein
MFRNIIWCELLENYVFTSSMQFMFLVNLTFIESTEKLCTPAAIAKLEKKVCIYFYPHARINRARSLLL